MWIATAAEMREIERRAADEFGVSAETLMENAGAAVFAVLQEMAPPGSKIAVVCGKGNNGGDGFVVARLAHEAGYDVSCFEVYSEDELGALCSHQMTSARKGGVVVQFGAENWLKGFSHLEYKFDYKVLVDAVIGSGFSGEPSPLLWDVIMAISIDDEIVLAVDVPSGVYSDTGRHFRDSVVAKRTVTLGLPKPFLFQGSGVWAAGQWNVCDLALPWELLNTATGAKLVEHTWQARRRPDSHKGDNGHVLIVAGSRQYRGAAALAALGALRSGAGLVTVAAIEPVIEAVAAQIPEAIFLILPEADGQIDGREAAEVVAKSESKFMSAVFGPGLTTGDHVRAFLEQVWSNWSIPSVIDADALNLVSEGLKLPKGLNVLTPHPGEAGRLLASNAEAVQADRFGSARALSSKFDCTAVLKGVYSIAALEGEPLFVNSTGNSGMATGGMGDVLSGIIATLLSQQHESWYQNPAFAAIIGMYWHGLAGDLAAQEIGEIGFSATDLAQFLPRARSILTT